MTALRCVPAHPSTVHTKRRAAEFSSRPATHCSTPSNAYSYLRNGARARGGAPTSERAMSDGREDERLRGGGSRGVAGLREVHTGARRGAARRAAHPSPIQPTSVLHTREPATPTSASMFCTPVDDHSPPSKPSARSSANTSARSLRFCGNGSGPSPYLRRGSRGRTERRVVEK